jgi:hypothetical protein
MQKRKMAESAANRRNSVETACLSIFLQLQFIRLKEALLLYLRQEVPEMAP